MAIKDVAKNLKSIFTKQDTSIPASVESGAVGTSLFSGLLDVDFNSDMSFPNSINIFDKMKKGDATVQAILEALKAPILSAKHFIQSGGKTPKDQMLADYIDNCLFVKLNDGDYKSFLEEALGFLENGFSYFEKVLGIDEAGFIYWKRFSPRVQSAHYKWGMQSKPKWVDGHPSGITQQLPGRTDDVSDSKAKKNISNQPEIPWDKLILFTNKKEGNNYEGVSILRAAYKHWYYKDLLYKIQGISAERFGVGIPVAKHSPGVSKVIKGKLEELVKNIRTNEQAYAVIENTIDLEILMPKGDPKAGAIDEAIRHHDRKIYDSILAGFLNLTSGEGGSNALSKDQSSFFLRSLQGVADYLESVINREIRILIDMNFQNVVDYPTLQISDIGQTSLDETMKAFGDAVTGGFIHPTDDDEVSVREMLGLPSRTADEIKIEREAGEAKEKEEADKLKKEEDEKEEKEMPEDKEEEAKKPEDLEKPEEKPDPKLADEKKKSRPQPREVAFTKNITDYENFLDGEFNSKYIPIIEKAEAKYSKILTTIYNAADTERVDGIVTLASSTRNRVLEKKALKAVNDITKQLNERFINSPLQTQLFSKTETMAVGTLKQNNKLLQEIIVDKAQFRSFISGYVSNMDGILFNEPRRIKENITLNFGSRVSLDLAIEQAKGIKFNRNVFQLSTLTHARAAYSNIITDQSIRDGFSFYKVLVPRNKLKTIAPSGTTAAMLFGIFTIAQLNKRANKASSGQNAAVVGGMGLHHGSYEYYYPIESEQLDEEEDISKAQRKKFEQMNK